MQILSRFVNRKNNGARQARDLCMVVPLQRPTGRPPTLAPIPNPVTQPFPSRLHRIRYRFRVDAHVRDLPLSSSLFLSSTRARTLRPTLSGSSPPSPDCAFFVRSAGHAQERREATNSCVRAFAYELALSCNFAEQKARDSA